MYFTIIKQVDPQSLKQDFEDILETVNRTSGIIFSVSAFNAGEFAIFANIQFLGPMGFKNKISFDISLKEKLIEKLLQINVKPEYEHHLKYLFTHQMRSWLKSFEVSFKGVKHGIIMMSGILPNCFWRNQNSYGGQ